MPLAALLLQHCEKANLFQQLPVLSLRASFTLEHFWKWYWNDDKRWCETKLDLKSGRKQKTMLFIYKRTYQRITAGYARTCAIWAGNLRQTQELSNFMQVPFLQEHIHMLYLIVWIYTAPICTWNIHYWQTKLLIYRNGHGQSGWCPIGCEGFRTNLNIPSPLPTTLDT